MRRALLIAAAALAVALAGGFYVLAYTQTGIELLVGQLNRLERLGIRVEGVSGRVTGPLRIARFELDHRRAHVVVEDIVIDLKLRWLALQTIDIDALTARMATIELKDAPEEPPPETPPRFLPSFLRIAVTRAHISDITFTTAGGQSVAVDTLDTALRLSSGRLRLDELAVSSPLFTAQGDLELLAALPLGLKFAGSGTLPNGERPDLGITASIDGTIEDFAIVADLAAPSTARVTARLGREEDDWRLTGQVTSAAFALDPWLAERSLSFTNVALDFSAQAEFFRVTGTLAVPEMDPGSFVLDAAGSYADRTLIMTAATLDQADGPARLRAEGRILFDGGLPALNVAGEWTQVQWPLSGASPVIASPSGRLTLSGPLPYRFSVSAAVTGESFPAAQALVNGVLTQEELRVEHYDINALDGTLTGDASLVFGAPLLWSVNTNISGIDPSGLHEEFPGSLDIVASAKGSGVDAAMTFDLAVSRLQGRLRGLPVNGNGGIERMTDRWRIRNTTVAMGEARLSVAGEVGEAIDLTLDFSARELEELWPGLAGTVSVSGTASGPRATPHVVARLNGRNLEYADWAIGNAAVDGDVDFGGLAPSRFAATLGNAGNGRLQAETLELAGQGNAASHALELRVAARGAGRATEAELEIAGSLNENTWTGQIASGRIGGAGDARSIRITQPANATVSRDHAEVEEVCVVLLESELCGNGSWRRGEAWQLDATGTGIPLDIIRLLYPDQPRYLGSMDLSVTASGSAQSQWTGTASLLLTGGGMVYQLSRDYADATETVQFGSGRADLQATADSFNLAVGLAATAETFIAATATATRFPGAEFGELPLTGRLRARMGDANLLPLLVAEVDHAAGVLEADVALSGSVAAPRLDGRMELTRGELDLYRFNLALREMRLVLGMIANRLEFSGQGRAGDGTWNLDGALAWRNGLPAGTLALKGENLLVADLPEYRVVASPDLNFQIEGRRIDAAGEVLIPSARIQPTDLSGAVQVSPDARLLQDEPATDESSFVVTSEIRMRLGEDVQLDTFGLQGRLGGNVGITTRPGEIAIGRGELTVANGKYEAYGQNLDIVRGRLLFDASPLDDPGLDIQAERVIETTRVGLNVRGTLRDPRFGFYSEPAMSQTQILSYLLVGKPIDDLQNRDTATVGSARDALALQGGGILAAQLGRRLGLGEIGVESNGANDAALVLGRFLSPRLFVSYGISLTESINTLKLRYTISDRWVIKMEAGENQSADMEFTIENP